MPGFVKPSDPTLSEELVDEVADVPPLTNLGVYGDQPPFLGLALIERIVNCDALRVMQEAGETYHETVSRVGSALSELATCGKVLQNVLDLKLNEAKRQIAQADSRVQELGVDVENKVAQLKEMGQKLEDATTKSEALLKKRDELAVENLDVKTKYNELVDQIQVLGNKYKEAIARGKESMCSSV